ncbi:hypothetical protein L532_4322 [Bordetella bronchiseptica OSU095]|uniref:hypothetical protein n=1 Tax=Bordetella bronchiseptica TaxID=518 RepID=UPI0004A084EE|nr:hypothetical protein [Bordetella bronchiseptica]KDD40929.1 hypothetical protein L532_4322 [Bordetella bronchiseptica OSU095]
MTTINDGGPAFPMQEPQAIHAKAAAAIEGITDSAERDRVYTLARAEAVGGMTLRDYFAAKAMLGAITGEYPWRGADYKPDNRLSNIENDARLAYMYADAMLRARGAQ